MKIAAIIALVAASAAAGIWVGTKMREQRQVERRQESVALADAGLAVAVPAADPVLDIELSRLRGENAALSEEIDRLKKRSPGCRVTTVASGRTLPAPVSGEPYPRNLDMCPACPACLLAEGDLGEVRFGEATLETAGGNVVLVAEANAWRVSPSPPVRLFGGKLQMEATTEDPLPDKWYARPRWGFGVMGAAGSAGWLLGPALGLPELELGAIGLELVLAGGGGPAGNWGVSGIGVARWR